MVEMSETLTVMPEYSYLIRLIRAAIRQETPEELPDELSFETVYRYAMEHDVANLAFYAVERLQKKPEAELYAKWSRRRDLALVRDMHQEFAYDEIVSELKTQGIPYKELQGTVLKKLYPRTEYRTMSDIDFIVEKKNLPQCGAILEKLGYRCSKQDDFEIDGFRSPDIYVELHTDYFTEDIEYCGVMGAPCFREPLSDIAVATELYAYNVLHIAKHYFASGCGIRRILDMYYLDLNYGDRVDHGQLQNLFEKAGVSTFVPVLTSLAREWFGDGTIATEAETMRKYIFDSGLQGKRENFISGSLYRVQQGETITIGTKLKYVFSRLFPGDKVMLKHFPVLERYRILYPVFWIYRLLRMILGRNRKASVLDFKLVLRAKRDHRGTIYSEQSEELK